MVDHMKRNAPSSSNYTHIATICICIAITSLNFLIPLNNFGSGNKRCEDDAPPASPYGLAIPQGKAVPLPSIQISDEEEKAISRGIYGGVGDKKHLGGFTNFDVMGVSPVIWEHMVKWLGVKSLVDVGCGRGISTSWFVLHGLEYVVCVEGSHDAVTKSLLPGLQNVPESTSFEVVEHDFSRGPWWPDRTVDVAWCVEFTEHVGRNYQMNYFTTFRKAAYIFMTHSTWGGWHHVEVHDDDWWIGRMESMGFVYSEYLTKMMREKAGEDKDRTDLLKSMEEGKMYHVAQHLRINLLVFINPLVTVLPRHMHLFAEHGCFDGRSKTLVECGKNGTQSEGLAALPDRYKPLELTSEMDKAWFDLIGDL